MTAKQFAGLTRSLAAATSLVLAVAVVVALGMAASRLAARPAATALGFAIVVAALSLLTAAARRLATRVPAGTILELDLDEPVSDGDPGNPLRRLTRRDSAGLREIVEALERAGEDDRVAGVVARIRRPAAGFAHAQELREAVTAFRGRGKFAVAYADSFGEFAGGDLAYYVASAFDEVLIQPSGDVGVTGVVWEYHFLRGALDKVGVEPRFDHRHEYKSAMEVLTERGFTPAHREATARLAESQFEQLVGGIAGGRGLEPREVRALIDRGPLFGHEAVTAGLVDGLAYRDEALDRARERGGDGATLLYLARYRRRVRGPGRGATRVALIHGSGAVTRGRSRPSPLTGQSMGSDTVAAALRAAVADDKVRAILFRIDSPGGSYVASDTIWREVVRARDAGKPVVASMGNVAASGGYFVAMAADRVVASPGTLTGSIGVVGGKAVLAGLRSKLGVATDAVGAGAHAGMMSASRDFRPGEWDRLQRWLDRVYADFTGKVAAGRGLSADQVDAVARGRVWTGEDAAARGLVDDLGGYRAAVAGVRAVLGLDAGAAVRLVPYPKPRPALARLRRDRAENSDDVAAAGDLASARAAVPDTTVLRAPAAALAFGLGLAAGPLVTPDPRAWS